MCVLSALSAYGSGDQHTLQRLMAEHHHTMQELQKALFVAVEHDQLLRMASTTLRHVQGDSAADQASGGAAAPSSSTEGDIRVYLDRKCETQARRLARLLRTDMFIVGRGRASSQTFRLLPIGAAAARPELPGDASMRRHDVQLTPVVRQRQKICTCASQVQLSSTAAWHSTSHGTRAFLHMVGAQVTPEGRLCVVRNLCPMSLQAPIPSSAWQASMAPGDWKAAQQAWPERKSTLLSTPVPPSQTSQERPSTVGSAPETLLKSAKEAHDCLHQIMASAQAPVAAAQPPAEETHASCTQQSSSSSSPSAAPASAAASASELESSQCTSSTRGAPDGAAAPDASDSDTSDSNASDSSDAPQRDIRPAHEQMGVTRLAYECGFLSALRWSCSASPVNWQCQWPAAVAAGRAEACTVNGESLLKATGFPIHPSGSVVIQTSNGAGQVLNVRREVLYLIDMALEHAAPGTCCLSLMTHATTHASVYLQKCAKI